MNPLFAVLIGLFTIYSIGSCSKPTTSTTTPIEVIKYLPGSITVKEIPRIVEVPKIVEVQKIVLVPSACDFSKKDSEIAYLKNELHEILLISRQKGR